MIRSGKCVFKTGDQQHYFNCPFQLGMGSDDRPTDADYYVLEDLEPDDVSVCVYKHACTEYTYTKHISCVSAPCRVED